MVVFAVDIGRRMMELRGTSLQCGRRTLLSQQCNSISGMARLTSRQGNRRRSGSERYRAHAAAPAFGLNSSPVLSITLMARAVGDVAKAENSRSVWVLWWNCPSDLGHLLPEAGDELAWTAALPAEDREFMRSIAK